MNWGHNHLRYYNTILYLFGIMYWHEQCQYILKQSTNKLQTNVNRF
jgi:hypothetical protein